MGEVIALPIAPNSKTIKHGKYKITVTYDPGTKNWKWSFVQTAEVEMQGESESYDRAKRAAILKIDELMERGL